MHDTSLLIVKMKSGNCCKISQSPGENLQEYGNFVENDTILWEDGNNFVWKYRIASGILGAILKREIREFGNLGMFFKMGWWKNTKFFLFQIQHGACLCNLW